MAINNEQLCILAGTWTLPVAWTYCLAHCLQAANLHRKAHKHGAALTQGGDVQPGGQRGSHAAATARQRAALPLHQAANGMGWAAAMELWPRQRA